MISKKLKKIIRIIKNFPKKGILFQDITSITDDNNLFSEVINEMIDDFIEDELEIFEQENVQNWDWSNLKQNLSSHSIQLKLLKW